MFYPIPVFEDYDQWKYCGTENAAQKPWDRHSNEQAALSMGSYPKRGASDLCESGLDLLTSYESIGD